MKKNRFLRAASGLLIATLISTCAISGTYAKYVTEGSVSDMARVADFGVVINAGGTLYSSAYYEESTTETGNEPAASTIKAGVKNGTATVKVKDSSSDNLVAPGTKSYGDGLSFGVTGTPEVSVNVAAEITAEDIFLKKGTWAVMTKVDSTVTEENFGDYTGGLYTLSGETYTLAEKYGSDVENYYQITDLATVKSTYYPVVYTLSGSTTYAGSVNTADAQAVAEKIAEAIMGGETAATTTSGLFKTVYSGNTISKAYAADTDLGATTTNDLGLGDLNLTWEWNFDDSGRGTYDPQDTILGDLIAQKNGTLDKDSKVVYNNRTKDVESYTAVEIGSNNYKVKCNGAAVAYLKTSFAIEISVTQID